jgi:hypothetical protein
VHATEGVGDGLPLGVEDGGLQGDVNMGLHGDDYNGGCGGVLHRERSDSNRHFPAPSQPEHWTSVWTRGNDTKATKAA